MNAEPGSHRYELKWNAVGILGKLIIDGLFASARVERIIGASPRSLLKSRDFILAFWHSRILMVSHFFKGWHGVAMVSASEDGEIIARILQRQGQNTIRGSTTRGGLRALTQLIREVKEGRGPAAVVPDGPQGPRFIVQPGVIRLAQKTGAPILPVTYGAERMKVFSSWDRFILPYPFTRCRLIFGTPIRVPRQADRIMFEACRKELEDELWRITREVDDYYGHHIS